LQSSIGVIINNGFALFTASNNVPIIAGGVAAAVVTCAVVGVVVAVKLCAKSAVSTVPQAATYQAPQVPGSASYNPPPSNTGNQGPTTNNCLRGGQDGPANTKSKIKLPEPTQTRNLPTITNGPQPPPANNGLTLASQFEPLPSIEGSFPAGDIAGVPEASAYTAPQVPDAPVY
jgi:hypothetical protein